ncbi:MAG: riboflavin synthase [Eubacteriales bacterium]|nr:riboflavin synthase [Eubacteriales bacterium]
MFTGIVEETGILRRFINKGDSVSLEVGCRLVLEGTSPGDSIAVNGICVTVTDLRDSFFTADIMPETVRRTNLSAMSPPRRVNLERALSAAGRLGGHIVNGHVDGTGRITDIRNEGNAVLLTISAPFRIMKYIVEKGSVSLDGVSLTVANTSKGTFAVSLIPATFENTALGEKRPGDLLNIECDIIGKYVEKLMGLEDGDLPGNEGGYASGKNEAEQGRPLTFDFLREHGYM